MLMFGARRADVAKLADAPDLGSGSRKGVLVQVQSSAPKNQALANPGNNWGRCAVRFVPYSVAA